MRKNNKFFSTETPINYENFSVRTANCLLKAGFLKVGNFLLWQDEDFLRLKGFGQETLNEIHEIKDKVMGGGFKNTLGDNIKILNPATLKIAIDPINFSVRIFNSLTDANIKTVAQALKYQEEELLGLRNFGRKSLDNFKKIIRLLDSGSQQKCPDGSNDKILFYHILGEIIRTFRFVWNENEMEKDFFSALSEQEKRQVFDFLTIGRFSLTDLNANQIEIIRDVFNRCGSRNWKIFRARLAIGFLPKTLEEVGQEVGLTRERVRQICSAVEKKLQKKGIKEGLNTYLEDISKLIKDNGGIQDFESVYVWLKRTDHFVKPDELRLIIELGSSLGKTQIGRFSFSDSEYLANFKKDTFEKAYGDLIDESESLLGMDRVGIGEVLRLEKKYGQQLEDFCIDIFLKNDGIFENQTLVGIKGKTLLNLEYILKEYPKGLHFSEIINLYCKRFFGGEYRDSVRGFIDRSENIILWDRGTYIHSEYVYTYLPQKEKIYDLIDQRLNNLNKKTSVISLYKDNHLFFQHLNVPSSYALYSLLRFQDDEKYVLRKFPDIEHVDNVTGSRKKLFDEVEEYFLAVGKDLFWNDLEDYFIQKRGLVAYQLINVVARLRSIYRLGTNHWIHRTHLGIRQEDIKKIVSDTTILLKDKKYLLLSDLINQLELPLIQEYYWNRTLLACVYKKESDFKALYNIAILPSDSKEIHCVEDVIVDIVRNATVPFTRPSLEIFLKRKKLVSNIYNVGSFFDKHGYLLEK